MLASPRPTETDAPAAASSKAAGAAQGQRLWAVLLVLDAFCVIVFGGALAAKVYQHWQAPAPVLVPQRKPRPVPAVAAAKPAEKPEAKPAAPPAEKKAAPATVKASPVGTDGMKPPKPSLLHEAPRHEAAQLASSGGKSAEKPAAQKPAAAKPAASADGKAKAVPVDFRLKAPKADRVELAGPFIVHGGKKSMIDRGDGNWTITIYLTPNTYRYHFLVDGKKKLDPDNGATDRGASVVTVP